MIRGGLPTSGVWVLSFPSFGAGMGRGRTFFWGFGRRLALDWGLGWSFSPWGLDFFESVFFPLFGLFFRGGLCWLFFILGCELVF